MNDVANSGRTVLFVSHNMDAVKNLCSRALLLQQGKIMYEGSVKEALEKYHNLGITEIKFKESWTLNEAPGNTSAKILSYRIENTRDGSTKIHTHDTVRFIFNVWLGFASKKRIDLSIHIFNEK